MQSPISVQDSKTVCYLTYPVFSLQTGLLTFTQLSSDSYFNLNQVILGDAELQVPSQYSSFRRADIAFKNKAIMLLNVSGDIRSLACTVEFVGAVPSVAGAGIFVNGAQSNYAMTGEEGVLRLSSVPSVIDMRNVAGAPRDTTSFNNVSNPPSPGSVNRWKLTSEIVVIIHK